MENQKQNRISGVESVINYLARETNSTRLSSELIKKAEPLMGELQERIDDYNINNQVANDVIGNSISTQANKTPIDLVGQIKRDAENEEYIKYQEARNER